MGIRIDALDEGIASRDHVIPAMDNNATVQLPIGDVVDLVGANHLAKIHHDVSPKTVLVDADEFGVVDTEDSNSLKKVTLASLISSVFKTARKIADAYFLSSFRLWDAADSTKGLAFNLSSIATATTRTIKMPDADVDLSNVVPSDVKAWVNFNGTGTVAIRASKNVSSVTDNGTGNYTVNFATPMPDANYATLVTCSAATLPTGARVATIADGYSTASTTIFCYYAGAPTAGADISTVSFIALR